MDHTLCGHLNYAFASYLQQGEFSVLGGLNSALFAQIYWLLHFSIQKLEFLSNMRRASGEFSLLQLYISFKKILTQQIVFFSPQF
jgi:hypothetical protein